MELIVDDTEIFIEEGRVEEGTDLEDLIDRYTDGERVAFDVEIDLTDFSPFQRQVLEKIREIPYGETRTYGEVADDLGNIDAARAVAQACNSNPLPIIIPCHRVVASDGIGGYAHGEDVKRALLELEGAI